MCIRYFGYKGLEEFDRLTVRELNLMAEALGYMQVDKQNEIHMLAFLTNAAGATRKIGNNIEPVYKNYKDFFDYEGELKKLDTRSDQKKKTMYENLSKLVRKKKGGEIGE